jgi:ATP adenylyltransferase
MEYILESGRKGCFFCEKAGEKRDAANFILYRNKGSFVILNIYPYTYAHCMVAPFRHARHFSALGDKDLLYFMKAVQVAEKVLQKAIKPQGLNVGLNIGKAAGAGIKNHIHLHVVPRWKGDINFMPILSEVRVLPERLEATYKKLKPYFDKEYKK